jgi:hypothetical protein
MGVRYAILNPILEDLAREGRIHDIKECYNETLSKNIRY